MERGKNRKSMVSSAFRTCSSSERSSMLIHDNPLFSMMDMANIILIALKIAFLLYISIMFHEVNKR